MGLILRVRVDRKMRIITGNVISIGQNVWVEGKVRSGGIEI